MFILLSFRFLYKGCGLRNVWLANEDLLYDTKQWTTSSINRRTAAMREKQA